jgi:cytidine deaminase
MEADVIKTDDYIDLGNIIISPEVASRQANNFHHPVERELAFLFIHGLLHAFGYEHHRSKEEAEEMFSLQNQILNTLPYDFYTNIRKVKGLLVKAQSMSVSPYSHFRVGAVILTKDGKYHSGFNIENSAYGDSMCAERVCMFSTYAKGYTKDDILSLSLITDSSNIGTPCGSCRQVMSELLHPYTKVHIFNKDFSLQLDTSVEELLPFSFTSEDLK